MSTCPLIDIKVNCGTVGLPEGCPLKAAVCPLMKPPPERGTFTDPRDGRTYKTVRIGSQTWLAENLDFECEGSKAYNNDPANRDKYGLLYDWETAKKAVPPGWHLPTNEEWQALIDYADGSSPGKDYDFKRDSRTAGKHLKAASGWNDNGNGTDDYGFSALPGGYRSSDGSFYGVGRNGYWWSAHEYNSDLAYSRGMYYYNDLAYWYYNYKSNLFSVRCVQDSP